MDSIDLEDYNYYFSKELIAQEAFEPRDHCKMLVLSDKVEHKKFFEIIDYLNWGDVLVLNETRVEHCKLLARKKTGAELEIILTKKIDERRYETRIKGNKLRVGLEFVFGTNGGKIVAVCEDVFTIEVEKELKREDLEILTPPYIKSRVAEQDYQTVFAKVPGSLAAPTAGLHFTNSLLQRIKAKGVKIAKVRLDISFETFLPVRDVSNHKTGKEYFTVDEQNASIINSGPIVAVGTTVVKCLESCIWREGKIVATQGDSQIFITPGFEFKASYKAMVTNFHLPKSSLLLLTCAFAGRGRLLDAYEEAVREKYRFYSLGDAMMILKELD